MNPPGRQKASRTKRKMERKMVSLHFSRQKPSRSRQGAIHSLRECRTVRIAQSRIPRECLSDVGTPTGFVTLRLCGVDFPQHVEQFLECRLSTEAHILGQTPLSSTLRELAGSRAVPF
jgi:hypothetical protein